MTDGVSAGCQTESSPGDTAVSPLPPSTSYRPPRESAAPDGAALHTNGSDNSAKRRADKGRGDNLHSSDDPPSPSGRSHRGSRLSEDWKPSLEDEAYASNGLTAEAIGVEAEKFRNHWISAAGPNSIKRDWSAAWRNWCLNSRRWNPGRPAAPVEPVIGSNGKIWIHDGGTRWKEATEPYHEAWQRITAPSSSEEH